MSVKRKGTSQGRRVQASKTCRACSGHCESGPTVLGPVWALRWRCRLFPMGWFSDVSDVVGLNLGHSMLILKANDFNRGCAVLF